MKKTSEKVSTLKDLREIRDKIVALEAAEVRRENAARVLERARAEMETRIEKQAKAVKRAEEQLGEAEKRNEQTGHQVRLLSCAVEQSTEGVCLRDLQGNLVYVNAAFAELHGYAPDELIGKPVSICHTSEQMMTVKEANKTLREKGTFAGKVQHMRRDKTVFAALVHNSILKDESGKEIGIIGTVRDISQLQEAKAACADCETRFSSFLESLPDGILICDDKFNITRVNKQACESLQYSKNELLKLSLADIQKDFDQKEVLQSRDQLTTGMLLKLKSACRRKDGSTFSTNVKLGLLESGESVQMFVILRNNPEEQAIIASMQTVQADLQKRIDEQKIELSQTKSALSAQRGVYTRETEGLKKAKADLESHIQMQANELLETHDQLLAKTLELDQLRESVSEKKGELQTRFEAQASELLKAQEALQAVTGELNETKTSLNQVAAELQKQLDEKSEVLARTQAELRAHKAEDSQAAEEMLATQIELEEQCAQQAAEWGQVRAALERQLEEKTAELARIQVELEGKKTEEAKSVEEILAAQIKLEEQLAVQSEELDEAKRKLEASPGAPDDQGAAKAFAASIADEMNSPMQTVCSILNTLKTSHRQQNHLMPGIDLGAMFRFERACGSLRNSIKNLREMTPPPEKTAAPVNVNSIIGNTISPLIGQLKASNIKVNLSLSPTLPRTTALPSRLGEVCQMLINRASHAMMSATESRFGEITIGTSVEEDHIVMKFSDNGPVLSDAEIQSIFETPPPDSDKVDLFACPAILKEHHGTIDVKRVSDEGMIFIVRLPVQ